MANYFHDSAQRLSDASARSYGALKAQLQKAGTATRQHNVGVKKTAAKKPAKKAETKQTKQSDSKSTAKKAAKKTAAKKS